MNSGQILAKILNQSIAANSQKIFSTLVFIFQTSVLWDIKAEVAQRAHYQAAGAGARAV